ncbi:MAG: carboxypeptidase regulatory-like domain-containing protein [bacterium]|nr:carboxypeptidase regulatory-like domain-containing protein [bacterium]
MRAVSVLLLVLVAIGVGVWLLGGNDDFDPNAGGSGSGGAAMKPAKDGGTRDGTAAPRPPAGGQNGVAPDAVGDGKPGARAVPTRTAVEPTAPEDLADRPTACLHVVDHLHGKPVAGAIVRRMKGGAEIGFTDEQGYVDLPLAEREQLAVIADRFLMRMAATRLGSTRAEPQPVQLVRDRWSVFHRIELRRARGGGVVSEAFVTVHPAQRGKTATNRTPAEPDPVIQRARSEDERLTNFFAGSDEAIRLQDGDTLRLTAGVAHDLDFATADGLADRRTIPAADNGRVIRIALAMGRFVHGQVRGDKGRPLDGAEITQQGGDPLALRCTTAADGRFSFGPLPNGQLTLLVRHREHEPRAFGPIATDAKPVITLRELPKSTLRGRVRRRPDLTPLQGATVSWSANAEGVMPITAVSGADGTFQLATTGDRAGRLLVSAPGCIALAELVAPGAPFENYDLLPSAMNERLEKRMTAVLAGLVVDSASRPASGVTVRWVPTSAARGVPVTGRRTISGNTLPLPLALATDSNGAFVIETDRFGPGRIEVPNGGAAASVATTAVAGKRQDGIRLKTR